MLRKAGRLLAPAAVGALLFATAACGDIGTEETQEGEDRQTMTLGTGSVGGDYYGFGAQVAEMWTQNTDVRVSAIETGASVDNLKQITNGTIQLGMAVNGAATAAMNREGDFEEITPNFSFIGNFYNEVLHITATADSDIKTLADLDGKRVSLGPDGSATAVLAEKIIELAGVEPSEVFRDGFGDASNKMRDGQADAAFGILSVPSGAITEVANAIDINFVEIPDDVMDQLIDSDKTLTPYTVEDGSYEGISGDWKTVTNYASLYADPGLSENQVYELTKALYENTGDIAHGLSNDIKIENAIAGVEGVEIHPGARKYYEEQGLL